MTKKMLQGMSAGILLSTLIFAYNFYFTDNFIVKKEIPIEREITTEEIETYLKSNQLITIEKEAYEELINSVNENDNSKKKIEEYVYEESAPKEILFVIEPGTSSSVVAMMLEEKQLINDRKQFEDYLINANLETKIRAGEYLLSTDMSLQEIVEKLT